MVFVMMLMQWTVVTFASGDSLVGQGIDGSQLSMYWVLPFVGILFSIAVVPLWNKDFWHDHYGKISAFWAIILAILLSPPASPSHLSLGSPRFVFLVEKCPLPGGFERSHESGSTGATITSSSFI